MDLTVEVSRSVSVLSATEAGEREEVVLEFSMMFGIGVIGIERIEIGGVAQ